MGLFSKKAKTLVYDPQISEENKQKIRGLFNDAVEDGDTYELLYGTSSSAQIEKGFYIDKMTTTFYFYILGWRETDNCVAVVEIDSEATRHGEAFYITMDQIKATNYYPKQQQAWFIYKSGSQYGSGFRISDCSAQTMYGLKHLCQAEERERFLDFFERYTEKLFQAGFKFKKWKR